MSDVESQTRGATASHHSSGEGAADPGPSTAPGVLASDASALALPGDGILEEAPVVGSEDKELLVPEEDEHLTPSLEQLSILSHLAVFAILGVLIRYGLELLLGPSVLHITDNEQALFLDVPANMAGSFVMGIVGFSAKKYIAQYSQPLAIGLSTGLCGSITTYASWNQRMLAILAYGYVARALFGYILGVALFAHSFLAGSDTGEAICKLAKRHNERRAEAGRAPRAISPEHYSRRWQSLLICCTSMLLLWLAAAAGVALSTSSAKLRKLCVACILGPFGCWVRWYLSKLNGGGVGSKQHWKWVPVGTLAANIMAAFLENITSACDAINDTPAGSLFVGGLQLGFMGCMSTVSTLMQEFHILATAKSHKWRAYMYVYVVTIMPSIVIGILIYCVPVWVYGVQTNGYNEV